VLDCELWVNSVGAVGTSPRFARECALDGVAVSHYDVLTINLQSFDTVTLADTGAQDVLSLLCMTRTPLSGTFVQMPIVRDFVTRISRVG
jgi:hypothetical protein